MEKSILVLEGGGLRGLFTAGVLDILMEQNIKVDAIIGVSAGALFGINYLSKQPGRVIRYNKKYGNDKRYMGFHSLLTTGNIMNKEFCFNKLVKELDPFDFETYKKSKTKLYAVVTNVDTAKAEYIPITDLNDSVQMEYLRASGSMPLVSKIVNVDGHKYLDGAVADSIPVLKAIDMKYDKIIVVKTRVDNYSMPHKKRPYAKLWYRKYPKFLKAFINRDVMYNETLKTIDKLDKDKKIFVIKPSREIKISRVEKNPNIMDLQYNLGRDDCLTCLDSLKAFIGGK